MKQLNLYYIAGGGHTVPNGSTVLPTDDVQILLNCADIWDKSYTTLSELFADSATLQAVINSTNAIDYLVRSKTFVKSEALVPVMTGYNTPSGLVIYDNTNTNQPAWRAFDTNASNSGKCDYFVGYDFGTAKKITKVQFKSHGEYAFSNYKLQYSDDNSTWNNASDNLSNATFGTVYTYNTNEVGAHRYWRLQGQGTMGSNGNYMFIVQFYSPEGFTDNATAMSYIGLNNYASNTLLADSTWKSAIWSSAYVLSVLNVKVPEMTSDTTPSGVCSASSYYDSRYAPYKAFKSTDAYGWQGSDAQGRFNTGTWCQYRFISAVKIVGGTVELKGANSGGCIIECLGSNDGFVSDTNMLNGNITFSSSTSRSTRFMTTGYTAYEYIRMRSKVKGGVGGDGLKFQFYGRQDV